MPSTSQRVRVGSELRRIREDAGLSGERAAEALGWSQSKLSRIETARFGVSVADLALILDYYGVSEEVRAELLSAIAGESDAPGAWMVRAGGPRRRQRELTAVESQVTHMRQYHPAAIPGQLHTREYATRLAEAMGYEDPGAIASRRVQRQALLDEPGAPNYECILDERALWRWPGSPAVMRDAIAHLIERAKLPTVQVLVLPMGGEARTIGLSPFLIYDFRAKASPRTVLIETITTDMYLSAPKDVARYMQLFDGLGKEALAPDESIDYLQGLARRVSRSRAK